MPLMSEEFFSPARNSLCFRQESNFIPLVVLGYVYNSVTAVYVDLPNQFQLPSSSADSSRSVAVWNLAHLCLRIWVEVKSPFILFFGTYCTFA